jgi:hypothetical protein
LLMMLRCIAVCGVRCVVCGVRCAVCGVRCAVFVRTIHERELYIIEWLGFISALYNILKKYLTIPVPTCTSIRCQYQVRK